MKKENEQRSFWEDAYDQCLAIARSFDALAALLEQNGQGELAHHIYTLFTTIPQSVAMRTPPAIRDRIAERIAAEMQAELLANHAEAGFTEVAAPSEEVA